MIINAGMPKNNFIVNEIYNFVYYNAAFWMHMDLQFAFQPWQMSLLLSRLYTHCFGEGFADYIDPVAFLCAVSLKLLHFLDGLCYFT